MVDKNGDLLLKDGRLYRNSAFNNINYDEKKAPTFASFDPSDVSKYITRLKNFEGTDERYVDVFDLKKDLKGPSRKTAEKIFNELWERDPNYRENLLDATTRLKLDMLSVRKEQSPSYYKTLYEKHRKNFEELFQKDRKEGFYNQILNMAFDNPDREAFAKELKNKGYDFIKDYHDIDNKFTKDPIILLNTLESVNKVKSVKITEEIKNKSVEYLNSIMERKG